MPDTVVDSTIVIDATNNHARAIRFIDELILGVMDSRMDTSLQK